VLLADDHEMVRQGLGALLERHGFAVVAAAADGKEAVELAATLRPDVAVLDVAMPVLNGVDAAREMARSAPGTRVILLTALSDAQFVAGALRAGVRGVVAKGQDIADLQSAIQEVVAGGLYVGPGVSQAVLDAVQAAGGEPAGQLTPRERQVLRLIAEGKAAKQIAQQLAISVKTVEFHRRRLMQKLKIHDTAGLVRYAIREGLIVA
jgi:DNA-binding NarL/FixJ family response regulator